MMARKLDFGGEGTAELLDDQVFLMDGSLLTEITKKCDADTSYGIGENVGRKLSENIRKTGISGSKMIEFMMDLLTMMGLGDFELHSFDVKEKKGQVRVSNPLTKRKCSNGDECSCDVVSGILSGIFSASYDIDFMIEETGCVLEGDEICVFKARKSRG